MRDRAYELTNIRKKNLIIYVQILTLIINTNNKKLAHYIFIIYITKLFHKYISIKNKTFMFLNLHYGYQIMMKSLRLYYAS